MNNRNGEKFIFHIILYTFSSFSLLLIWDRQTVNWSWRDFFRFSLFLKLCVIPPHLLEFVFLLPSQQKDGIIVVHFCMLHVMCVWEWANACRCLGLYVTLFIIILCYLLQVIIRNYFGILLSYAVQWRKILFAVSHSTHTSCLLSFLLFNNLRLLFTIPRRIRSLFLKIPLCFLCVYVCAFLLCTLLISFFKFPRFFK